MRARASTLGLLATALVLGSCSSQDLPDPDTENLEQTFTIGALWGTPVGTSSAFKLSPTGLVRTDITGLYDFLYDIDPVDGPSFYPAEVTGTIPEADANPGLMLTTEQYDSIKSAKINGYITDAPIPVDSGSVLYVRSIVTCGIGVPFYGKLEVLSIDSVAKTLTFRVLANQNCGYRDLEPGLPDN